MARLSRRHALVGQHDGSEDDEGPERRWCAGTVCCWVSDDAVIAQRWCSNGAVVIQ